MKKLVTFCLIGIFLISGCARLKELYGIQPQGKEEIISIDEIKVQAKENDSKDDNCNKCANFSGFIILLLGEGEKGHRIFSSQTAQRGS